MEFIERYKAQRESLRALIREHRPERVGIEFPVFDNLWSEGMYGLFLYSCEALRAECMDVVFWSPLQAKAHARDTLDRPKGWKMDKVDMCEAAKQDVGGGRNWNHNSARPGQRKEPSSREMPPPPCAFLRGLYFQTT